MKDRALAYLARCLLLVICLAPAACGPKEKAKGVCITGAINLAGVKPGDCFKPKELAGLVDKRVTQGPNAVAVLELTDPNDSTKRQQVKNCRAYDKLKAAHWYAMTGLDMSKESWFQRACGTVAILMTARPARRSYLDKPPSGLSNPKLISAAALPQVAESPSSPKPDQTIADLVESGQVHINTSSKSHLDLVFAGNRVIYDEVARGDFNGDGVEDMLIFLGVRAVQGTMHWYEHIALTRKKAGAPLTVVLNVSS
jgi:hypothetical protein